MGVLTFYKLRGRSCGGRDVGGKSPWVFSSRCNVCFCVTVWSIFLRSLDDSDSHDDRDGQSNTSKFLVRCKRAFYSVPTRPSDRLGGYKSGCSPESTSTLRRLLKGFIRPQRNILSLYFLPRAFSLRAFKLGLGFCFQRVAGCGAFSFSQQLVWEFFFVFSHRRGAEAEKNRCFAESGSYTLKAGRFIRHGGSDGRQFDPQDVSNNRRFPFISLAG